MIYLYLPIKPWLFFAVFLFVIGMIPRDSFSVMMWCAAVIAILPTFLISIFGKRAPF